MSTKGYRLRGTPDDDFATEQDMVNHPPHYQGDGVECIDAIRAALGKEGFIAYCRGNAMKYIWREKADSVEDRKKAIWYLNKANEEKGEMNIDDEILADLDLAITSRDCEGKVLFMTTMDILSSAKLGKQQTRKRE